MSQLLWIITFTLLGGALSVMAAGAFLLLSDNQQRLALPHAVSFATGALLGAAFLALLPHALEAPTVSDPHDLMVAALGGVLAFFVLEKLVLYRHCHATECETHGEHGGPNNSAAGTLILIGDSLHNFVDGVLIAAAFLTDTRLGIVTALAVAAHEIPQEVGDFAVLLHSGFTRARALTYNLLSSLATVVGGVLSYYWLRHLEAVVPYVLAIAAASFAYVALADLIPTLHKRMEIKVTAQQLALIAAGVGVIYFAHGNMH